MYLINKDETEHTGQVEYSFITNNLSLRKTLRLEADVCFAVTMETVTFLTNIVAK